MSADAPPEDQTARVKWLRDRGVEIEFAEGDTEGKALDESGGDMRDITLVKIPCNEQEKYEEMTVRVNDGEQGDQLKKILAPWFKSAAVDLSEEKVQEAAKGLLHSAGNKLSMGDSGRKALEEMLVGQGHAEAFALTTRAETNGWQGVSIYLDEAGQLKQLPPNKRAAQIAAFCGMKGVALAGDCYIARIGNAKGGALRHISFSLGEVASSAAWLKQAERDNYQRGVQMGNVAMPGGEVEAPSGADPSKPYTWSQEEDAVDVVLKLGKGKGVTAKKALDITIEGAAIRVAKKGAGDTLLDLKLHARIDPDGSTWTISGDNLEFSLEKSSEQTWPQLESK